MAKEYSIEEHIHRFAVWTAARAVQRGFTTTKIINTIIDRTDLRKISEKGKISSVENYKQKHISLCKELNLHSPSSIRKKMTFGRASKIVSIYLKTAVIIASKGKDKRAKFIYPPIDGILLKNLARELTNGKKIKNKRWTTYTEEQYFEVLKTIKDDNKDLDWKLEKYWKPVDDK